MYVDTKRVLTRRGEPLAISDCALPVWDSLDTCVVADSRAKHFGYDTRKGSRRIAGLSEQLEAIPGGSRVLLVGGWNNRLGNHG